VLQCICKLGDAVVAEQPQEQEGPKHADGIEGLSAARIGGGERFEGRPGWFQVEAQQHQRGVEPGFGEAAGLALEPAEKAVGEGFGIVLVVGGHGFLLRKAGRFPSTVFSGGSCSSCSVLEEGGVL
jgi:hypothetical protein